MFSMNSIRHRKTTSRFQNNTQHRNTKYKNHIANPISGIVDTLLDLTDTQAYEEQQRQMQRFRKEEVTFF